MRIPTARTLVILAAVLASGVGGFTLRGLLTPPPPPAAPPASSPVDGLQAAFVGVAQRVRPAVVNVGTVQIARRAGPQTPGLSSAVPAFEESSTRSSGAGAP